MPDTLPDTGSDGAGATGQLLIGNQSQYARYRGWKRQTVHEKVKAGKIPIGADGLIDFAKADQALRDSADPARQTPAQNEDPKPPADAGRSTFQKERTRAQRAEAELKEIKLAALRGELLRTGDVADAMAEAGKMIRRDLDRLPVLADEIHAAAKDGGIDGVRRVLKKAVAELEQTISNSLTVGIGDSQ